MVRLRETSQEDTMSIRLRDESTEAPFAFYYDLDEDGRISRKVEVVKGSEPREIRYAYDDGKLLSVSDLSDGRIAQEQYSYNRKDQREASLHTGPGGVGRMFYDYEGDRLLSVNLDTLHRNADGFRNERWQGDVLKERYTYSSDYRLLKVEKNGKVIDFDHDENGFRSAKYLNGQLVETYQWHRRSKMASCNAYGIPIKFGYLEDDDINPACMKYDGVLYTLWYDQVGSLRVVADEHEDVVKEITYDSFGRILNDTNPAMRVPIGFGGGLPDPDVGWVRMGYRDYDPETGRFTAKDPLGPLPGYSDVYDYCADDPINLIDPLGLTPRKHAGADSAEQEEEYTLQHPDTGRYYWTVHPKDNACDKCQAMAGQVYETKPDRPHPNCKCEIRKHENKRAKKIIMGRLDGYRDGATHSFRAKGDVTIKVDKMSGALLGAISIIPNYGRLKGGHILDSFEIYKFKAPAKDMAVDWEFKIISESESLFGYTISFMEAL